MFILDIIIALCLLSLPVICIHGQYKRYQNLTPEEQAYVDRWNYY